MRLRMSLGVATRVWGQTGWGSWRQLERAGATSVSSHSHCGVRGWVVLSMSSDGGRSSGSMWYSSSNSSPWAAGAGVVQGWIERVVPGGLTSGSSSDWWCSEA